LSKENSMSKDTRITGDIQDVFHGVDATNAEVTKKAGKIQWQQPRAWPEIREEAYYGPIGEAVRILNPATEADPRAVLITLIVALGNIIGKDARVILIDGEHPPRIFALITGETGNGKKGTSSTAASHLLKRVDPEWFENCRRSGFASGEGFLSSLDKAIDKRCFSLEVEFARILAVASREGDTLSARLRAAYDGSVLENHKSESSIVVKEAHLSMIGHITPQELQTKLSQGDMTNGFMNRFLFCCSRRSKHLPFGGELNTVQLDALTQGIKENIKSTRNATLGFSDDAKAIWKAFYCSDKDRGGLIGGLTARADTHTLRMAVLFAILDGSRQIEFPHFQAALAVWDFSRACAAYAFGDLCQDRTQTKILDFLRAAYPGDHSLTDVNAALGRNVQSSLLGEALDALEASGLICSEQVVSEKTGRRARHFSAVPPTNLTNLTNSEGPGQADDLVNSLNSLNSYTPPRLADPKNLSHPPLDHRPFRVAALNGATAKGELREEHGEEERSS